MGVIFLTREFEETEFTERFEKATTEQLVEAYNREVGNPGWVSARGRYLFSLYHEFKRRGIDISVIDTGNGMALDQRVGLDCTGRRLVLVDPA